MSVIEWQLVLVWIAAVPQTIFVLVYGLTNHWWASWIGRALFSKALGLALLLDASLLGYYFHNLINPTAYNIIVGVVVVGACLQLYALILDKYPDSRSRWPWLRRHP